MSTVLILFFPWVLMAAAPPEFQASLREIEQKNWSAAESALLALGTEHPDQASVWHNLGYVYLQQGKTAHALAYFRRASSLRESWPLAQLAGAQAERSLEKPFRTGELSLVQVLRQKIWSQTSMSSFIFLWTLTWSVALVLMLRFWAQLRRSEQGELWPALCAGGLALLAFALLTGKLWERSLNLATVTEAASLRVAPAGSSLQLAELSPGREVEVLDGPRTTNDELWLPVRTEDDLQGWILAKAALTSKGNIPW